MLNRYMPADTVQVVSLDQCAPVLLETPGKGFLFSEPLARTGSTDKAQIYGEIGLEYRTGDRTRQDHRPDHRRTCRRWRVRFTSSVYKELVVHDLGVTFVDGEAEVSDKATADALRGLPAELGVRAIGGRPAKEPTS